MPWPVKWRCTCGCGEQMEISRAAFPAVLAEEIGEKPIAEVAEAVMNLIEQGRITAERVQAAIAQAQQLAREEGLVAASVFAYMVDSWLIFCKTFPGATIAAMEFLPPRPWYPPRARGMDGPAAGCWCEAARREALGARLGN